MLLVVAACEIVTGALGLHYAGKRRPGAFDRSADTAVQDWLGDQDDLLDVVVTIGDARVIGGLCAVLAIWCLWRRDLSGALLAVLGPLLAGVITTVALKPLVGRRIGDALSYPSGHTTGAFAVAVVVAVLLFSGRVRLAHRARLALSALGLLVAACVAVAMIGHDYHYTTDTIGGVFVAVGAVLTVALAVDAAAERWWSQASARARNRS